MYILEETDERFTIAESTQPNAGDGLFAKELIKKGDFLEVIGVMVKCGSSADICTAYANSYKFAAAENPTNYIVPLGYAGIVNHTNDKALQNVALSYSKNRSKRSAHAGQVVYEAIRDIQPGEELLGHYGDGLEGVLKWANEKSSVVDHNKVEWNKFLAHNLYDLGILKL